MMMIIIIIVGLGAYLMNAFLSKVLCPLGRCLEQVPWSMGYKGILYDSKPPGVKVL